MTDPILLTPGPLTTSAETKSAMLSDWGSWDGAFNELTASVCRDLVAIVDAQAEHVCVPLQGSGTFAVEAALGTLVPRGGKVLVPDNGSLLQAHRADPGVSGPRGRRAAARRARAGGSGAHRRRAGRRSRDHARRAGALRNRHGDLESAAEIAGIVAKHGRGLIVDAMSSYGAIPIDARTLRFDALVAASGKCLEGVPGMGFVIARRTVLERSAGNSSFARHGSCSTSGSTCRRQGSGASRRRPTWSPRCAPPSISTRRRADWRLGWHATPRIARRWCPACGRWASGHSCRTPCRRPSS